MREEARLINNNQQQMGSSSMPNKQSPARGPGEFSSLEKTLNPGKGSMFGSPMMLSPLNLASSKGHMNRTSV
jgi:hypothetical protein